MRRTLGAPAGAPDLRGRRRTSSRASSAFAGEYAVLASGMRLRVDRHEQSGASVVLYSGEGSMTLGAGEVAGFEPEDYVAPKPAVAAPVPTPPAPVDPRALVDAAAAKNL